MVLRSADTGASLPEIVCSTGVGDKNDSSTLTNWRKGRKGSPARSSLKSFNSGENMLVMVQAVIEAPKQPAPKPRRKPLCECGNLRPPRSKACERCLRQENQRVDRGGITCTGLAATAALGC